MDKKNPLVMIAGILLVVGGLNWGLVGIGAFIGQNLNLVELLFGATGLLKIPVIANIIYILVGVSAIVHASCCLKSGEKK